MNEKTQTSRDTFPRSLPLICANRRQFAAGAGALLAACASGLARPARAQEDRSVDPETLIAPDFTAGPADFDFLEGEWIVTNRRLRQRLAGAQDWEEFPAAMRVWKLLDGFASVDEFDCPALGFKGLTVRTLEVETRRWAIYWTTSISGVLALQVRGGFKDGKGLFFGKDTHGGRPVLVRFIWTSRNGAPRWEQAFSVDGGKSWETNWIVDLSRA